MLNLTADPIVLIAQSGESTTIPASGCVARAEYERRNVDTIRHTICDPRDEACRRHIPIVEQAPKEIVVLPVDGSPLPCPEGELSAFVTEMLSHGGNATKLLLVSREVAEAAAYLRRVTCNRNDCADVMHRLHHPLAARMAWAEKPVSREVATCTLCCQELSPREVAAMEDKTGRFYDGHEDEQSDGLARCRGPVKREKRVLGYRELRRVAQGGE